MFLFYKHWFEDFSILIYLCSRILFIFHWITYPNIYIFIACDHSRTSILFDIAEWMNKKTTRTFGWFVFLICYSFLFYFHFIFDFQHTPDQTNRSTSACRHHIIIVIFPIIINGAGAAAVDSTAATNHYNIVYWKKRINHIFDFETTEQSTMRRKNTELCRISFEKE